MQLADWFEEKTRKFRSHSDVKIVVGNLIFAGIYFVLAKIGLGLATLNHSASPVWPATGFAFAGLYFYGNRLLPAILLGAFLANSQMGGPLLSAIFISIGNSLEAFAGALILRKVLKSEKKFGIYAQTVAFASAAFISSVFSASFGVLTLYYSGGLSKELIGPVWLTWWVGDSLGGLVVAPLLIKVREFDARSLKRVLQLLLLALAITYFVFFIPYGGSFLFLLFPILLFAARSFDAFWVVAVSGFVCLFGVLATALGTGPFAIGNFNERLIHLQIFLGAYAFTAIALSSFQKKDLNRNACAIFLICWALAGSIFYSFDQSEAKRTQDHFKGLIQNAEEKIKLLEDSYEEVLRGGVGLFLASKAVEYDEWKAYNHAVNITQNHLGMNGLGVIWPVKEGEISSFEKSMRAQGLFNFKVKTVPGGDGSRAATRYVIKFVEPLEKNVKAFGLDVSSEKNRREGAELSRDLGVGVLSPSIILVQDERKIPGSLFYLPIYKRGSQVGDVESRRRAHLGWVYAPIVYEDFFSEMFNQTSREIILQVFEGADTAASRMLFSNFGQSSDQSSNYLVSHIRMGNRDFTLKWAQSPTFVSSHNTIVAWVGLCGALATLLLGHLMMAIQTVGTRSREIADELTKELSQSREKFKEGERRLLYALDGSNDGIWDWNIEKSEMYVSGKIAETHGWPQCFRVNSVKDLKAYAHPEDLKEISRSIHNLLRGVTTSHEVETRYKTTGGSWRWVLTRGKISERDPDGKPIRMTGVHIDIHDLKDAQKKLEATQYKLFNIANSVPTKVSLWDKDLRCEFANERLAAWFGLSIGEIVGKNIRDLVSAKDIDERMSVIQRALSGESFTYEREVKRPSDNQNRHIIATYRPNNLDGVPDGFFLFIQDITELKNVELQALEEKKVAVEATNVKSQFLANMSHEIRTPLNGIVGMTKLLSLTALNEQQKEYASLISQSSMSLLNLINDILDFSKVEAGKLELENVDFSLKHLVSGVVSTMSFAARENNLILESILDLGEADYFKGDPGRVRQVLINLVSNAIKFTKRGSVKIYVKGLRNGSKTDLRFEIVDTGIGIRAEARDKIFKAFSQADASMSRRFGGTGLGLSICQQLVHLMGGTIGVESEFSKGSTFWFRLELPNGQEPAKKSPEVTIERTKGARILVAEDNRVNQQIAVELLESLGYLAHAVANGKEALDALRDFKYDLILMDCQMPEMDGYETTRIIRTSETLNFRSIPIVAMTANAFDGDKEKCVAAGMNGYVSKPIDENELVSSIEYCLKKSELPVKKEDRGHILVVEDNKVNQHVIGINLNHLGYSFDIAENGVFAIEALRKKAYDLVLMDCQMPEMDGFEATRRIRQLPDASISTIPIVALTANALKGDRERCIDAGMNDYLTKPIDVAKLVHTLEQWKRTRPKATAATIDKESIQRIRDLQQPGNKPNLLTVLIDTFFDSANENMVSIRKAAQGKDIAALIFAAHSLKSSAANLGAKRLSEVCFEIEMLTEAKNLESRIEKLLFRLESEYAKALQELEVLKRAA